MVVVLIIAALIYCALPWYIEIVAWTINLFLADAIPFVDELLMFVPVVSKIKKIAFIANILEKYWKLLVFLFILTVVIVIYFIVT